MGTVCQEPAANASWANKDSKDKEEKNKEKDGAGKILYELNGQSLEIPLHAIDCDLRNFPHVDDIVKFDINQSKATKETNAVNIVVVESKARPPPPPASTVSSSNQTTAAASQQSEAGSGTRNSSNLHQGYIAAIKDGFGFLETLSHDKEIFFHFSNVYGKAERLEVGQEVEYAVYNREKGGKLSAEGVRALDKGTIAPPIGLADIYTGKVVRPLRSVNPDQDEYCGLIQVCKIEGDEGKKM
jgi:cold shock CspA family protein